MKNFYKINRTKSSTQYFFILLLILINSKAPSFIGNNIFILSVFIFSAITFKLQGHSIDKIIYKIIVVYFIINFLSYLYNNTAFDYITFFGYILQILTSYFIIKIIGFDFFRKLEKVIFILTFISLPIYFLEQFFRSEFYSLSPFLNFMTGEEQQELGGWYVFIYMFSAWGNGRNSGFMWEPGAFALMIIIGIILHYFTNNALNKRRILIYIISLISTFSTMGYIVFLILFATYILQKQISFYWFLLFPILILTTIYVEKLPFIGPELQEHYEQANTLKEKTLNNNVEIVKTNRLGYILIVINETVKWPLGYGNVKNKHFLSNFDTNLVMGASTFGHILYMWGWLGIYFWIRSTFLFFNLISSNRLNKISLILLTTAIILAFSSNPLPKSPILIIMVLAPYIFKYLKYSKIQLDNIYGKESEFISTHT